MNCTSCGTSIDRRAAFCSKCGELTQGGQPLGRKLGTGLAELANDLGELAKWAIGYVSEEANRKRDIVGGVVIALLLIVLTENPISSSASSLFDSPEDGPQVTAEGTPEFSSYEDTFVSDETEFVVMGKTNVRDYPTTQGTQITHSFSGGETVVAREVKAFDPNSRWYKLKSGGYVWGGNLEGGDQIQHEAGYAFPAWAQGKWSNKDQCPRSNSGDIYVVVEGANFYVNGYGATLTGTAGEGARTSYFLKPLDQANDFDTTIELQPSADGRSFTIIHIEPHDVGNFQVFDDELPCSAIMRQ